MFFWCTLVISDNPIKRKRKGLERYMVVCPTSMWCSVDADWVTCFIQLCFSVLLRAGKLSHWFPRRFPQEQTLFVYDVGQTIENDLKLGWPQILHYRYVVTWLRNKVTKWIVESGLQTTEIKLTKVSSKERVKMLWCVQFIYLICYL